MLNIHPNLKEIYDTSIRPLNERDKLQIASLILEDVIRRQNSRKISLEDRAKARQRPRVFAGSAASGNSDASDNER